MKQMMAVMLAALSLASVEACDSSTPEGVGGAGGGGGRGSGGLSGSGGALGSGGVRDSGGMVGSGGRTGMGGQSGGGATGAGGQTGVCPYTVASFSCEAACAKLHDWYVRCENDPAVPAETLAMLSLYAQVEVVCTSTCAVVAPSSQAQWECFQGMPDDAPCAAIAGCNATNCP